MKKLILAALLLSSTPALAVELHPDPGMNTPGLVMLDPASPNLWTVSAGVAHGNSAKNMQMLMWAAPGVKAGHSYQVTFTVAGQTHGVVEASLGSTMSGAAVGSYVVASGFSSIADNFTTANGLTSAPAHSTPGGDSGDAVGAFRIFCSLGTPAPNDPVVYRNLPGRSHLHSPWGNTQSLRPTANYSYYRAHGGTTCGNNSSKTSPIDRAAYWMPSMLDGAGNVMIPLVINQYYKRYPATADECTNPANPQYQPGAGGGCVATPQGLAYISGYNFSTGLGGPGDDSYFGHWECWGAGTNNAGNHAHLSDFFHGGCAKKGEGGNAPGVGGVIGFFTLMANCWDGVYLDTPDHRAHVIEGVRSTAAFFRGCPDDHPYQITAPQPQVFYEIDDNFVAGKWHLSSDEMVAGKVSGDPGGTMHMDFTDAWSPAGQSAWETNCEDAHNSCSSGDLGNSTAIKDGGTLNSTGGGGDPIHLADGTFTRPKARYYPTSKAGIGRPVSANGTYTQVITASADGRISLIAIEDATGAGFDGTVDNMSVTAIN